MLDATKHQFDSIPQEMRGYARWVVWDAFSGPNSDKLDKESLVAPAPITRYLDGQTRQP